jgi:putative Ca2+/H+ antiporter (TMEM165/GDT1 family)
MTHGWPGSVVELLDARSDLRLARKHQDRQPGHQAHDHKHGAVLTALTVIFLAEWGDLTQILTANLAAKYHAVLPVVIGSVLALLAVAGIAIASGESLLRFVNIVTIRKATAIVLLILATYSARVALR